MKKRHLSYLLIFLIFVTACNNPQQQNSQENTTETNTLKTTSKTNDSTAYLKKPSQTANTAGKTTSNPVSPKHKTSKKTTKPISVTLDSWNNTKSKKAIIDFVKAVTTKGSPDYLPPVERVAAFDNDGTLISEQPTYFQIEFILYRIKKMAPEHPKWKKDKLMKAAVNHDLTTLRNKFGLYGIGKLMSIVQDNITVEQYEAYVKDWMKNGRHPVTGKPYSKMVFQPMMELIRYLQQNGFKIYIVSGGDTDFMRAWSESVYGIPRENIIGSYQQLKFEDKDGKADLIRQTEMFFVNDGKEKPKSIYRAIGRKPVIAFGNSDGDIQMMEWCNAGKGKKLVAFIHHTDAKREYAYDKESRLTSLKQGLDIAAKKGWLVVDIKKEWKTIYPD